MRTSMPSETITGAVGTIVAAVVGILLAYGVEVPAGAVAGITVLISWLAYAVTLVVRLRRGRTR